MRKCLTAQSWQGLSRGKPRSAFDARALALGTKVEMEHTDNRGIAERIAMDHLTEDSRYYTKLAKMEKNHVSGRDCGGWAPTAATASSARERGSSNMALPNWPGAAHVYSFLGKRAEEMGAANYKAYVEEYRRRGRKPPKGRGVQPTEEMREIQAALRRGDEIELKSIQMRIKQNEFYGFDTKTIPKGANRSSGYVYKGLSSYDLQVAGLLAQNIATDDPIASAVEIIRIFKKRPQWKWISEAKPSTAAEMILDLIHRETKQVRRG